jgi:hypothetical protein
VTKIIEVSRFEVPAIHNTHPTVVTVRGDEAFDANDNAITIDQSLVDTEIIRLQAEYDSQQYARDRALAYPSLTDQADMAYWDRQDGTTTLDDAIAAVKAEFPKP